MSTTTYVLENICCGYSLEAPQRGASNEYPQHMFLSRNKKDISIFRMKKAPYLLLCMASDHGPQRWPRQWLLCKLPTRTPQAGHHMPVASNQM